MIVGTKFIRPLMGRAGRERREGGVLLSSPSLRFFLDFSTNYYCNKNQR